jgi:hypothetical protein
VPSGYVITQIVTTGAHFDSANPTGLSGSTWKGASDEVELSVTAGRNIKTITVTYTTATKEVTVTSAGFATYCNEYALDFTGKEIKAYLGSISGTTLTFTPATTVPANTGMLLVKDGGATEDIPVAASASGTSCLTGVLAETTINSDDYILNMKDGKPGFYPAGSYTTLGAHKAYITKATAGQVKGFAINFDGDETLVEAVKALNGNAAIYNLAGQRVNRAQKGVFIQNGKKFIVK